MTDRPNITDVAGTVNALAAVTQKLKDATADERHELIHEFTRLLALTEAMIMDWHARTFDSIDAERRATREGI